MEIVAVDFYNVVKLVNNAGAAIVNHEKDPTPANKGENALHFLSGLMQPGTLDLDSASLAEFKTAGLDNHDGRKQFLAKLGVDGDKPKDYQENYRLVASTSDQGQAMLFKGHMDGNTLVLTDSITVSDNPDKKAALHELLTSSFKPLPKPITFSPEQTPQTTIGSSKDEINVEIVIPKAEDYKRLQMEFTFASLVKKAENVELTSINARLPKTNKIENTGPCQLV